MSNFRVERLFWNLFQNSNRRGKPLRLLQQSIDKPGSVVDDHLSSSVIAQRIKRITASERTALYARSLAADRVYLLRMSPYVAVSSYLTRFTLTRKRAVSFLWHFPWGFPRSPLATVFVLCCPDFPLAPIKKPYASDHLMNCLPLVYLTLRLPRPKFDSPYCPPAG